MNSAVVRLASLSLVAAIALAGCGSDDGDKKGSKESSSPDASTSTSASTEPDDGLTDPGTALKLGDPATFVWKATAKVTGTAEAEVTRIDKATMKAFNGFKLTDEMKKSTPYYVHLKVTNAGKTNLGGFEPPVFLDNGSSILYPAAHINGFAACNARQLPAKFGPGKKARLCMVFLAPAGTKLRTVALRPDESQEQIDWTGKVTKPGEKVKKSVRKS